MCIVSLVVKRKFVKTSKSQNIMKVVVAKKSLLTFLYISENLEPLNQSKKNWCYSDFIYYCKGKIWSNNEIINSYKFDCFCYTLYYFNDVNRFLMANIRPWHDTQTKKKEACVGDEKSALIQSCVGWYRPCEILNSSCRIYFNRINFKLILLTF